MGSHAVSVVYLLLVYIMACILVEPVQAMHAFDAYRMIHMENSTARLGSQRSSINLVANTISSNSTSFSKRAVMIPFENITLDTFTNLIHTRDAGALVILLPENMTNVPVETIQEWNSLEQALLHQEIPVPVYFAHADPFLLDVYRFIDVHGETSAGDSYHLVVSSPDVSVAKDASITNLQGTLSGAQSEIRNRPVIAVVASYDSFGLFPEKSTGSDSSNVVALLELVRIFSKLYSEPKMQGKYDILFVLTSGGALNYAGAHRWVEERSAANALDNVEFVLCLDSLDSDALNLHVSRPPKDESVQAVYQAFNRTATQMQIPFQIAHKKINLADSNIYWEHEQFSRKRVLAATISGKASPVYPYSRTGFLANKANVTQIVNNIRYVAEALASYIYHIDSGLIMESYGVMEPRVAAWTEALTVNSRFAPFLRPDAPLLTSLEQALKQFTSNVVKEKYPLEGDYKFYGPTSTKMTAYRAKPWTFDLYFSIAIAAYFVGLYAFFRGESIGNVAQGLVNYVLNGGAKMKAVKR